MLPPRAYTFIGLNIVRVLSIVALVLMFASSIVTLAHYIEGVNRFISAGNSADVFLSSADPASNGTDPSAATDSDYIPGTTVPHQPAGAFWAVLNRLLIVFQVLVLVLSELGWPAKFFDRYFPVLGKDFGLGPLGVMQCLIGAAVLSHFVDTFALVAAFFLFSLGCVNMLVGLVFRASARSRRSIFAWRERAKDVLPVGAGALRPPFPAAAPSFVSRAWDGASEKLAEHVTGHSQAPSMSQGGLGFGRQAEKAAALKGFLITKPVETLPRYAPK